MVASDANPSRSGRSPWGAESEQPHDARRRPLRTTLATLAGALLLSVTILGCGGGSGGSQTGDGSAGGPITVYSGQHEQTVTQLVKDFTQRTGIEVALRSGSEGELANQLIQEGSGSPADVFYAGNSPALEGVANRGLLAEVAGETLKAVSADDSSPAGAWVGVSARASVLAYNTAKVRTASLPSSILDLTQPAWQGRVGFAPTETDFQPLVSAISKLRGADAAKRWLQGLKRNGKVYEDNEAIIAAVNRGEVATGLVEHYYWYRLRDELGAGKMRSGIHSFAAGDPGALVAVSGAGVLASSKRQPAAQEFLAYLVSEPAQRILTTSDSYEYPLLAGVTNPKLARSIEELGPPDVGIADLGDGRSAFALMQEIGLL